jgi:hypothetical protein
MHYFMKSASVPKHILVSERLTGKSETLDHIKRQLVHTLIDELLDTHPQFFKFTADPGTTYTASTGTATTYSSSYYQDNCWRVDLTVCIGEPQRGS